MREKQSECIYQYKSLGLYYKRYALKLFNHYRDIGHYRLYHIGRFLAMQKRLDLFGVLILGFVTAIGGGTLRDVLIGNTPGCAM